MQYINFVQIDVPHRNIVVQGSCIIVCTHLNTFGCKHKYTDVRIKLLKNRNAFYLNSSLSPEMALKRHKQQNKPFETIFKTLKVIEKIQRQQITFVYGL